MARHIESYVDNMSCVLAQRAGTQCMAWLIFSLGEGRLADRRPREAAVISSAPGNRNLRCFVTRSLNPSTSGHPLSLHSHLFQTASAPPQHSRYQRPPEHPLLQSLPLFDNEGPTPASATSSRFTIQHRHYPQGCSTFALILER